MCSDNITLTYLWCKDAVFKMFKNCKRRTFVEISFKFWLLNIVPYRRVASSFLFQSKKRFYDFSIDKAPLLLSDRRFRTAAQDGYIDQWFLALLKKNEGILDASHITVYMSKKYITSLSKLRQELALYQHRCINRVCYTSQRIFPNERLQYLASSKKNTDSFLHC